MKKLKLTTAVAIGLFAATPVLSSHVDQEWNPDKSMTAALEHTINITKVDPCEQLVGRDGPSPSNQALVVMMTNEGAHVLMCKDFDLRKLDNSKYRPTHGALKASFGFGFPNDHDFKSSYEALLKGPANIALYKLFDHINPKNIKSANFVYSEGGQGWGPAVTIPLFLTGDDSALMNRQEADHIVAQLNQQATAAFESKQPDDIFTGRFRDFTLVPLKTLLHTGSDQPAVMDEDKLEVIKHNGQDAKLWDESQMRLNLLPHVDAVTSKFYK